MAKTHHSCAAKSLGLSREEMRRAMLAGSMIGFFIAAYATFAAGWADARLIAMAIDYYAETGPDSLDEDQMRIPQRIPDLFPGAISFTRSHMLGYFGFQFSLRVALNTPHVAHSSGTDQQTGRLELASHRQLASRERMRHRSVTAYFERVT